VMVRLNGAKQRAQRGFTLLEMMIVVVVIAILAIVVVPSFFREGRKVKASSEVNAMFTEIRTKLETFKTDTGAYADLAECPTTTGTAGVASATCAAVTSWAAVRINPPEATLRCKYEVTAGAPTDTAVPPTGFTFASPAASWYWILATCDGDDDPSLNATFFVNSVNGEIQKQNEAN